MTITATVHRKHRFRIRFLWIMLLGLAGTPCLAQQVSADASAWAVTMESDETLLDSTYVQERVFPLHIAFRTLPPQRITEASPALPSPKLSAVIEPPPLPALDALPITPVTPGLNMVPVRPPTPLLDSLPEPVPAVASYYHASLAGNLTASGERYNPQALTAAHRTLPFGTRLRITNVRNGKSVVVRVNDRGPFVKGRGIDLSRAAADLLGIVRRGVARVMIQELDTSL